MCAQILTTLLIVLATAPLPAAGHRPGLDSGLPAARLLSKEPTKNTKGGATQPTKKQTQTPKTSQNSKSTPQKKTDKAPSQKSTKPNLAITNEALLRRDIETLAWDVEKTWSPEALKCILPFKKWQIFSRSAYLPANLEPGYPKIQILDTFQEENEESLFCSFTLTFKKGLSCDFTSMPTLESSSASPQWVRNNQDCLPYVRLYHHEVAKSSGLTYEFTYRLENWYRKTCHPEATALMNEVIEKFKKEGAFINGPEIQPQNVLAIEISYNWGTTSYLLFIKKDDLACCLMITSDRPDGKSSLETQNLSSGWKAKAPKDEDGTPIDPCKSLIQPDFVPVDQTPSKEQALALREWKNKLTAPLLKAIKSDTVFMKPDLGSVETDISKVLESCFHSHSNFEVYVNNPSGYCPIMLRQDSDKKLHITHSAEINGCQSIMRPERLLTYFVMPR